MEEEKKLPKNIRQMAEIKLYRACTHWYIAWKQNGYRKQKMLVCKGSS